MQNTPNTFRTCESDWTYSEMYHRYGCLYATKRILHLLNQWTVLFNAIKENNKSIDAQLERMLYCQITKLGLNKAKGMYNLIENLLLKYR